MVLTELQGSITTTSNYSVIGPIGQVSRRCLNCVSAMTGPVLFGVFPSLPYIVAFSITLAWVVLLFVVFLHRIKTSLDVISNGTTDLRVSKMVRRESSFQKLEEIRGIMKHSDSKRALMESLEEAALTSYPAVTSSSVLTASNTSSRF